jgi:hypothetical protein
LKGPLTGRKDNNVKNKFSFEDAIAKSSTLKLKNQGAYTSMNTPRLSPKNKDKMKELKKPAPKFDIMHFFKTFKDEKVTSELPNLPLCDEEA